MISICWNKQKHAPQRNDAPQKRLHDGRVAKPCLPTDRLDRMSCKYKGLSEVRLHPGIVELHACCDAAISSLHKHSGALNCDAGFLVVIAQQ